MSSIIVLDSSDEESEPSGKKNNVPNILPTQNIRLEKSNPSINGTCNLISSAASSKTSNSLTKVHEKDEKSSSTESNSFNVTSQRKVIEIDPKDLHIKSCQKRKLSNSSITIDEPSESRKKLEHIETTTSPASSSSEKRFTSLEIKNNRDSEVNPNKQLNNPSVRNEKLVKEIKFAQSNNKIEENCCLSKNLNSPQSVKSPTHPIQSPKITNSNEKSIKRIKPTLVSDKVDQNWIDAESPIISLDDHEETPKSDSSKESKMQTEEDEENPVNESFATLLEACRKADPSEDMNTIINKKLLKYYHSVHPDFVNSRGFCKTVKATTEEIRATPEFVYYKLRNVVDELKIRKKSKITVMCNENISTTGDEKKDHQVKRLSKALYVLKKRIAKLERSEVDWNDDDSVYLQKARYERRACQIYNKICDLTGESKHAYRAVKKPIIFHGTDYPQFNRAIQTFVNKTRQFPDYFDVYRCLEYCNVQYTFGLRKEEIKRIAQDAFIKIGESLQDRRKSDLYETVTYFTASTEDPAESDPTLDSQLKENQKYRNKINSIIDRFAKEQEIAMESEKKVQKSISESNENDEKNKKDDKQESLSTKENEIINSDKISGLSVTCSNNNDRGIGKENKNTEKSSRAESVVSRASSSTIDEIVISDEDDL